jgi:transposase
VQKWRNREDTVAWRTKKWDGPVILQTNGYAGYNAAANGGAVHAGCWSHLRRYFVDAVKLNKLDAVAADLVQRMDAVFAVDREAVEANMALPERLARRREKSAPMVAGIHENLLAVKETVLPKSKLGEAGSGSNYRASTT